MNTTSTYQLHNSELTLFTKIELCFEFPMTLLGSAMYLAIIHFEHFGGDPMKRSIVNKLVSALCLTAMVAALISILSLLLRVFLGAIPMPLALAFVLGSIFGALLVMMNLIGIFTFKSIRLLSFHFANRLDEDFWFMSFEVFSVSFCLVLTILEIIIAENPMPLAQVIAGNHPWQSKSMIRILFGLIGVGAFVTIFGHTCLSIWMKSRKSTTSIEPAQPVHNNFNVLVYNPTILNDVQFLAITIIFILSALLPFCLQQGQPPETADQLVLLWMPLRMNVGVTAPFLFYGFNKELRAYCKREFWDIAPEWLQKYNPNLITIPAPQDIELTPVERFP